MRLFGLSAYFATLLLAFAACVGEDRSGEQPFAPTVKTVNAIANGNSCTMTGAVTASPNSTLSKCGFAYGTNNGKKLSVNSKEIGFNFSATVDSLDTAKYYVAAFATNGMGTSYGDTIWIQIP